MNTIQDILYCQDECADDAQEGGQFDTIDDMDYFEREIEALGVELESEIITQKEYNAKILELSNLSSPTNIIIDKKEQSVPDANIMSLINANNEKMTAMEKRLEKLTTHCEKLETLLEQRENEAFPDIEVMQREMRKLHRDTLPSTDIYRSQLLRRNYNDIQPCTFKGERYWSSTDFVGQGGQTGDKNTRLFDYNTYEYIGILVPHSGFSSDLIRRELGQPEPVGISVNPVYAVKYKDKYPELFEICISQKLEIDAAVRPIRRTPPTNPWAIVGGFGPNKSIRRKRIELNIYCIKYTYNL